MSNNACDTESSYEYSNACSYKLARQSNKNQRFKPYDFSKAQSYRKPCAEYGSRSLADVLQEHRHLQTSVSSEDHYVWDLVEVVVEIPYSNECHENSTQQQTSYVQTTPSINVSDLSQHSPLENDDVISLSVESAEDTSCQASCTTNTFNHYKLVKHDVSDYHSFQPPYLYKAACKSVVNLKHTAYDNSRGDYYPNIGFHNHMSNATQTYGYLIRCWKRYFSD